MSERVSKSRNRASWGIRIAPKFDHERESQEDGHRCPYCGTWLRLSMPLTDHLLQIKECREDHERELQKHTG